MDKGELMPRQHPQGIHKAKRKASEVTLYDGHCMLGHPANKYAKQTMEYIDKKVVEGS